MSGISFGRRMGIVAVATAATAAPIFALADSAQAAVSKDSKRLCSERCAISVGGLGNSNSVDEGKSVKVNITGKPGTYKVRAFRLEQDKSGKKTTLKPAGPVQTVKVGSAAGSAKVAVDPVKAPLSARKDAYTVQPADVTDATQLVANGGTRIDQFSVNSHRALLANNSIYRDTDGDGWVDIPAGQQPVFGMDFGLPGDTYGVDIKTPQGRRTITVKESGNGVIKDSHTGLLYYDPTTLGLGEGVYDLAVYNVKDPGSTVATSKWRVGKGNQPPAPSTSPEPSKSATSAPKTAAPKTAAPKTATPKTAAPKTAAPKTATPKTAAPKTATPKTAAPKTAAPKTATPKTTTPKTAAPKTTTPSKSSTPPGEVVPPTAVPKAPEVDNRVASLLLSEDGQGGPNYEVNGDVLTSWGKLADADGAPIANATVIVRAVRDGAPATELGRTSTDAEGKFGFDARLPADRDADFEAALIFEGDADHKPATVTTKPQTSPPADGAPDAEAPDAGAPDSGDSEPDSTPVDPADGGGSDDTTTGTSSDGGLPAEGPQQSSVNSPTRLPSTGASDLVVPALLGAFALTGGLLLLLTRRKA